MNSSSDNFFSRFLEFIRSHAVLTQSEQKILILLASLFLLGILISMIEFFSSGQASVGAVIRAGS